MKNTILSILIITICCCFVCGKDAVGKKEAKRNGGEAEDGFVTFLSAS